MFHSSHNSLQMHAYCSYIYTVDIYSRYIFIIFINNSRRKDKGNQCHDGSCISDTKFCWFTYTLTLIYFAKMALIFNIVDKHEHLDVGVS